MSEGAAVPATAKQAPLNQTGNRDWIDRAIWTERMLAALDNGVKGNEWFSLIDKVYRPHTLAAAWEQVKANKGAVGIDGQSIERFAAGAERYVGELAEDLKEGRYQWEIGHERKALDARFRGHDDAKVVSVHKRASQPVMDLLRKNVVLLRSHFP